MIAWTWPNRCQIRFSPPCTALSPQLKPRRNLNILYRKCTPPLPLSDVVFGAPSPKLAAAQPRMSNDTWEEVVSSSLTTQSLPESHSDDGSKQPEQSTAPSLIISGANFDEDVDGTGSFQQARGAFILMFIILVWVFAAICPVLVLGLVLLGGPFAYTALAAILAVAIYPNIVDGGKSGRWMWLRHAIVHWGQRWHRSCGRAYEKEGPESWDTMPLTLFCYHPHGVFTQSYVLNGGLNDELPDNPGLLASALYYAPVFQLVAGRWLDVCAPASKKKFIELMEKGTSFAMMPGGFQEASLSKLGTDRVWLKQRRGFIKYALKHGCRLRPIYTFGECDTYWNMQQGSWKLRLWLASINVPGVLPVGMWWCPLLPRRSRLMTVFGEPLVLPKIETPSSNDVDKWHGLYVEALTALFDRHKAKYASNPEGQLEVW
ncbi:unnamed protein product [Ascophyllum nodosum]